jgi:hypothetical protein
MPTGDSAPRPDVLRTGNNTILADAIDMHVHGYPDAAPDWPMRTDDHTMVQIAHDCGMRGLVLKSHFWPTIDRARMLTESIDDPHFEVFGSITLNPLIGGVSPATVEAAAIHGAKVVFMPTWGSQHDIGNCHSMIRTQIIDRWFPRLSASITDSAISLTDGNGRLLGNVRETLEVAAERQLVLSTGHVSVQESLLLAEAAAAIGFHDLVFAHPLSSSIGGGLDAMRAFAGFGGFIEITAIHAVLPTAPIPVAQMFDTIQAIGVDHVIISSDVYFDWMPPHAEMLRMITGQLQYLGLKETELRTMLVDNPHRLLNLRRTQAARS